MDEDVVGLARVSAGDEYGTCTRCGAPVRRRRALARREPHAREYEELCDRCCGDLLQGETTAEVSEEE